MALFRFFQRLIWRRPLLLLSLHLIIDFLISRDSYSDKEADDADDYHALDERKSPVLHKWVPFRYVVLKQLVDIGGV
jgi:hypothetical protein